VPTKRLRPERRDQVWALDFTFDSTSDGRPIKALAMCDEYTRESIGRQLRRSITADDVVEVLDQAKAKRGAPECIRMDNGPELIASAIRDWCRLSGTDTIYIEPGSSWENPFVESFNAGLRDELFNREIFHSVFEAKVLYFDWCDVYNNFRPTARSATWRRRCSPACSLAICRRRSSCRGDDSKLARGGGGPKKRRAEKPQDDRNAVAATRNTGQPQL
jgi:putative transposase